MNATAERCSCGTPLFHTFSDGRSPKCPHCDNVCVNGDSCTSCRALQRADLHNVSSKLPKWKGPLPTKDWNT